MTQETDKKFYHIEICHQKYIEQQEYQKQENKKWSDLFEYIKELHEIIVIPTRNIKRLQELRGGFDIKEGKKYQRYRIGVEFDLMLEAYKLQEDKIKWFIKDVLNDGKDASDINKCISMMLNGLNTAWQNRQIKLKQELHLQKEMTRLIDTDMSIDEPIKTKRKKDNGDISHLL
jgi:hypothetical protein